jgi:hypothetical protein
LIDVTCHYCGKKSKVKPCDIDKPDEYHCRDCHPQYLKDKRNRGEMKWDRSALNKIKQLAALNGHPTGAFMETRK